jgi:ferrous iron transport protein A
MTGSSATQSLGSLAEGLAAMVLEIEGGSELRARLCSMGIVPGTPIEVLRNTGQGPIIVKSMGSQLVLGRGMTLKIGVRPSGNREV